ncbi:conserved hypothetical protein [Vibrio nigripulchritudo SOn1]|uniref:Uncharacterized protein n=1 Tax=Vibrio nigripulchritudo SOn1 TaxID=1238450 RepID=A0AAV2VVC6_9VIBR|nr:hypothetical protein [Vibrio nigripulchritudo]CCO48433.1 conserved hypothetical protein [Vibrio nigripulchritudo SOn1]
MTNQDQPFGEVVEVYTQDALLQLQRITINRQNKPLFTVNVTLSMLEDGRPVFESKKEMRLEEHGLSTLCQALMGLKHQSVIKGNHNKGKYAEAMFININPNETVNIILTSSNHERQGLEKSYSVTFYPDFRYKLLALAVSQLTLNSKGYSQTISETLSLLKAAAFPAYRR